MLRRLAACRIFKTMTLIFWLLIYLGILILEVAVLPVFGGSWTPAAASAFLVMGIALQDFYPAFWFAGLAGLTADFFLSPGSLVSHTVLALTVFFVVSFFRAVTQLDQPLYTIASLAVGFLACPLSWFSAILAARTFFQQSDMAFSDSFRFDRLFLMATVYASIFIAVFSWLFVRRFARRRATRLSQL